MPLYLSSVHVERELDVVRVFRIRVVVLEVAREVLGASCAGKGFFQLHFHTKFDCFSPPLGVQGCTRQGLSSMNPTVQSGSQVLVLRW